MNISAISPGSRFHRHGSWIMRSYNEINRPSQSPKRRDGSGGHKMAEAFQPGDVVIWAKGVGGGFAFPVLATVVRVTAKRVTIKAEDPDERGEGVVTRHVSPANLLLQRRGEGDVPKK